MPATISLARGWPAPECLPVAELADCARGALERDGTTILSYGPVQRLRAAAGMGRRTARRRPVARVPHERLAAGIRVPRAAARPRAARARRAAHVRPAAEDPLRARRRDRRARLRRRGPRSRRARGGAREAASRRRSCICFRRSRTRAAARCPRIAVGASSSWPPSTTCSCSRTIRTGSSASRARRRRRCTSSPAGRRRTARRSRRRSSPGLRVGWFVLPEALARELEATATGDVHHARAARAGDGLRVPAARSLRAEPRAGPRPARRAPRRDARGVRARAPRRPHVAPRRRVLPLGRARRRRRGRAAHPRRSGRRRRSSRAPTSAASPNSLRLAYSFVSPDEIGEGVARLAAALPAAV